LGWGTQYTFRVQARYSSALSQPTTFGDGKTVVTAVECAPQLLGQRNGDNLTLTWPEFPSAHLEGAASLTPPVSWVTVTNHVNVGDGQKSVVITPTGGAGYFRLIQE
jgi:hypothetical protein